jgi:hypothetical protein
MPVNTILFRRWPSLICVLKTTTREKVVTLQIGQFKVYEVVKYCPECKTNYRHDDLRYLVPEFCNFGYDIIEYVGRALFLKFRTVEQIIEELKEKNVTVSEREVTFLGKKFIFYLAYAHKDKSAVSKFVEREDIKNSADLSYQKMYNQIKKYWKKLFADAVMVTLPNGEKVGVYLQKTNNIMERFFRELNRGNRKRNGCKSLGRTLQTMLAETPIVKNLNNPEYVKIILNGKSSLAARFAEVDAELIRKEMKKLEEDEEKLPVELKKLLKIGALPRKLLNSMAEQQSCAA